MITFIVRRLILIPVVVFGCILLVFAMMQLLSPVQRLSLYINNPNELRQIRGNLDEMMHEYGLDKSIPSQFVTWFGQVIRGDLGWSESAARTVSSAFTRFMPVSAELALWSALPIVLGGILLGSASAVRHNKLFDHTMRVLAIIGWSLPTFVAGLLSLFLFYGILKWFPPGQIGLAAAAIIRSPDFTSYTGIITLDSILNWNWFVFGDALRHLFLPVTVLSLVSWAMLLRITRASMLETLRQDYVTTARSKGLRERVVIKRHARRNALIAPITVAGITVAFLFNGLVITETIFDFHGLGRWAARAAQTFDLPALLGYLLFNGVLIVFANLVVDILYAQIDPRVRLE